MKKSYLLLILFAFFSTIIFAQQDSYKWKIGLHSGGMGYVGDLNSRLINPQTQWLADPTANLRPAFGLSVEYAPGANFGLRALWSNGQFTANDRIVSFSNQLQTDAENFSRALNARTKINDVSLIGTFYLQRSQSTKKRSLSPYIMLGAGLTQFEVFGDLFLNNDSRYYYWSDFTVQTQPESSGESTPVLQDGDYETNLTKLQTENVDYATTVGNIPIGLGFKWKLGDKLSLNFETLWHYTFTDYLDDVSGTYPTNFDNPLPLQSHASNPSGIQNDWRGREEDRFNDMYSFNSISLNYSFGYRKDTRPIEGIAYGNDTKTIKEITTIVLNEKGDTLKIEQKIREDDAKEAARLSELDEEKRTLEEEIAMLENQLEEAGELPETPESPMVEVEIEQPEAPSVKVETPDEVLVEVEEPKLSRRERRRLEKEAAEAIEIVIEEPGAPNAEITMEQPEAPNVEVVIEPEVTIPDNIEMPETPDTGGVVTEPAIEIVMEGERPGRPARPDISLGGEEVTEVVIEVETPSTEMPNAEVEVEVPETRESRRERRRNRKDINKDIVIETPEEPSVEIVVGDNITIEMPEEIEVTQPEAPTVELGVETPETPMVEVEVETPETPEVEIEVEQPETPMVEVEIEQPEAPEVEIEVTQPEIPTAEVEIETPEEPMVKVEVEQPEMPEVAIEIEAPETPEVAIEVETPEAEEAPKKLTRRDIKRMRRNPPDVNKTVEVESETATVPEEVMAEVREEPIEEMTETPNVPAIEVETPEEVAIETPKVETKPPSPRPTGTPTREGALNPKISSPSAISFTTTDEARQAYEGFYMPFEDEAYYVSKELYTELDGIVRTMNRFPALRVTLQGHTSEQEGVSFIHQEITRKRVHYIQNYLVTKGVDLKRIQLNFFDDIANINEANKQQVDIRFD